MITAPIARAEERGHGTGGAGPTRKSLEESGHGQSAYQVHDEDVTAATVHYLDRLGVQKRAGQPAEPFFSIRRLYATASALYRAQGGLRALLR